MNPQPVEKSQQVVMTTQLLAKLLKQLPLGMRMHVGGLEAHVFTAVTSRLEPKTSGPKTCDKLVDK